MVDLTQLITNLQADVNAADSDTSTKDILALLHRGSKITTFHKWYDSAGVLPIDSAYGGYMAFTKSDNTMRVFNDSDMRWAELDSAVVTADPYTFQGSVSGYVLGGYQNTPPSYPSTTWNIIDKFSLSTDANATDVGDLTAALSSGAGNTSSTHAYHIGGYTGSANVVDIQKVPFSTDENAVDVGDLLTATRTHESNSSSTTGYKTGGYGSGSYPDGLNSIEKFPFATDANSTDGADLAIPNWDMSTHSTDDNGYLAGGQGFNPTNPWPRSKIEKFPFASDTNATVIADMHTARYDHTGTNSTENGYSSGGEPSDLNAIEKFNFVSEANGTDVGDLTVARQAGTGISSTTHGYTAGGNASPTPGYQNVIDKFPFATDANATDVADLTQARGNSGGAQV